MTPLLCRATAGAQRFRSYWTLPLRAIVGFGFMQHGYAKLARGPEAFPAILHALGMPAPHLLAWAAIGTELAGGAAMLLGLFMPLASIPMMGVLIVAILTVHLPNGFSSITLKSVDAAGVAHFGPPGYETDLLYMAAIAALVLGGPGPLTLERVLERYWRRTPDPAVRAGRREEQSRAPRSQRQH
jgi:putative oxidoreductase